MLDFRKLQIYPDDSMYKLILYIFIFFPIILVSTISFYKVKISTIK